MDNKPERTIETLNGKLYYRHSYDERTFKDWQKDAEVWIKQHHGACIHDEKIHHMYVDFETPYNGLYIV